jgi:hypothetical protein
VPVLAGLLFPACAQAGAAGLPPPAPIDLSALRPNGRNQALLAIVADAPADRLEAALLAVAAGQPRTFRQPGGAPQLHFVARSRMWNFPDLVTAGIAPGTVTLYSRSVYGRHDLGANAARLQAWRRALAAELSR